MYWCAFLLCTRNTSTAAALHISACRCSLHSLPSVPFEAFCLAVACLWSSTFSCCSSPVLTCSHLFPIARDYGCCCNLSSHLSTVPSISPQICIRVSSQGRRLPYLLTCSLLSQVNCIPPSSALHLSVLSQPAVALLSSADWMLSGLTSAGCNAVDTCCRACVLKWFSVNGWKYMFYINMNLWCLECILLRTSATMQGCHHQWSRTKKKFSLELVKLSKGLMKRWRQKVLVI